MEEIACDRLSANDDKSCVGASALLGCNEEGASSLAFEELLAESPLLSLLVFLDYLSFSLLALSAAMTGKSK